MQRSGHSLGALSIRPHPPRLPLHVLLLMAGHGYRRFRLADCLLRTAYCISSTRKPKLWDGSSTLPTSHRHGYSTPSSVGRLVAGTPQTRKTLPHKRMEVVGQPHHRIGPKRWGIHHRLVRYVWETRYSWTWVEDLDASLGIMEAICNRSTTSRLLGVHDRVTGTGDGLQDPRMSSHGPIPYTKSEHLQRSFVHHPVRSSSGSS